MSRMHRRTFVALAGSAAAPAVIRVARAQTPEVTLKMHHFLPAVANGHKMFLAPWSEQVMKVSGGRIKIDIFPAMQLGGTPPQLFDQARDGVADIVWTLPGNTPGRFPRIEVFELPFVAARRAVVNSKAIAEIAPQSFMAEFGEVQPLCLWAHDHGLVHANKPVRTIDDFKGLKLRFPTRLAGEALKALGANAIGMPIPQVPQALAQRVIDGCVVPWEVVPSIKVQELVKNHTEIPGSPTLYTATFVLAMNKAKYNALPPDLKKVIDDHSGMVAATMAGEAWDAAGIPAFEMTKARGNTIITLAADEKARWEAATKPVIDRWLVDAKAKGIDGEKLLADAKAALARFDKAV